MTPAEVFHVGDYLRDEMDERNITTTELEKATGIRINRWEDLLARRVNLLGAEAEALERIGWGSALTWLALNHRFVKWWKELGK